jgi:hypothetical protein
VRPSRARCLPSGKLPEGSEKFPEACRWSGRPRDRRPARAGQGSGQGRAERSQAARAAQATGSSNRRVGAAQGRLRAGFSTPWRQGGHETYLATITIWRRANPAMLPGLVGLDCDAGRLHRQLHTLGEHCLAARCETGKVNTFPGSNIPHHLIHCTDGLLRLRMECSEHPVKISGDGSGLAGSGADLKCLCHWCGLS